DYQSIIDDPTRLTSSAIADPIFFRKAISCMSVNAVHDALVSFKKSISLNDRQSDVFYARGMLHYSLGRYEAAANDHQRALELSELNSTVPLIYQTLNPMYNSSEYYNNIRIVQERPL
ncbi:unnamed protein product, partial [Rotaria magnacalcarata]